MQGSESVKDSCFSCLFFSKAILKCLPKARELLLADLSHKPLVLLWGLDYFFFFHRYIWTRKFLKYRDYERSYLIISLLSTSCNLSTNTGQGFEWQKIRIRSASAKQSLHFQRVSTTLYSLFCSWLSPI